MVIHIFLLLPMSEPIYDEDSLIMHKKQQRKELMGEIWQYAIALEQYVVYLRNEVNTCAKELMTKLPYPAPESDFAVRGLLSFQLQMNSGKSSREKLQTGTSLCCK